MIDINDKLYSDFEAIRKIPIVPMMLDVICQTTGMGFAAVARVTGDRWLACSVLDQIQFGLTDGEELKVATTICDEIRDSKKFVVIDHVSEDAHFCTHHTPAMYGFQSYISFPIILANGEFFGTLCAIDPRPADLNNSKIIGMFTLFTQLLSFHLQSLELIERSNWTMQEQKRQLNYTHQENRQYQQIANHNFKEQVRKISVFSDMLMNDVKIENLDSTKKIANKIHSSSHQLAKMFDHLSDFSALEDLNQSFESTDLNQVITAIHNNLSPARKSKLLYEVLPAVYANPAQVYNLFDQLINHVLEMSNDEPETCVRVYNSDTLPDWVNAPLNATGKFNYCEVLIEITSSKINTHILNNIFDFFIHMNDNARSKYHPGLAYCRKIVHNHGGFLTAHSVLNKGVLLSVMLPYSKI